MKLTPVVHNVPIPPRSAKAGKSKYASLPLDFMKVGDSFTVTMDSTYKGTRKKSAIQQFGDCITQYVSKYGSTVQKRFILRTISDTEVRIWRKK